MQWEDSAGLWEKEAKSVFRVPEREHLRIADINAAGVKHKIGWQQNGRAILWNRDFCKGSSRGLDPGSSRGEGLEARSACFVSDVWAKKKLMAYIVSDKNDRCPLARDVFNRS